MKDSKSVSPAETHGPLKSASKGSALLSHLLRLSYKNNRELKTLPTRTTLPSNLLTTFSDSYCLGTRVTPTIFPSRPAASCPSHAEDLPPASPSWASPVSLVQKPSLLHPANSTWPIFRHSTQSPFTKHQWTPSYLSKYSADKQHVTPSSLQYSGCCMYLYSYFTNEKSTTRA